jgi:hypothetical protein
MAERNKAVCSPPFSHDKVKTEAVATTYDIPRPPTGILPRKQP